MIEKFANKIIPDFQLNNDNDLKPNIFFRPDMFKLIMNRLYLMPICSEVFIKRHFDENKGN